MNPNAREPVEEHLHENQPGPGHRLREARLEKKLSLEEVASRLRLDPSLMEALEQDDYKALPEPAFVRGYLRGYARLLDLPVAPILESYDRHGFSGPNILADIANRPQARSSDLPVRAFTFLLVGVLVVLAGMWWASRSGDAPLTMGAPEDPATEAPESPPAALPPVERAADLPLPPPPPPAEEPLSEETLPDERGLPGEATPAPAPQSPPLEAALPPTAPVEAPAGEAPESDPGPEPAEGTPAADELPLPGEFRGARAPGSTAAAAGGPAGAEAGSGPARLSIRFPEDSWVEIYDGTGERLFFNLAKAGRTIQVKGEPPLRVLLGYARDVEVTYNGEPFDHRPFTSKDVARFTVGGE